MANAKLIAEWRGIILDIKSKDEGVNEIIKLGYEIQDYFKKGLEADLKSHLANHCMGTWCYEVASLGKVERAFASTFYDAKSTFEEALKYALAADEYTPNELLNTCLIAQCYEKLDKKSEAKEWAQKALKLTPKDSEMEATLKQCQLLAA